MIMSWLDSIVKVVNTIGNIAPRALLVFLGVVTFIVLLIVLLIRLSGLKKFSLTSGAEFDPDGAEPTKPAKPKRSPKKPMTRQRSSKK